MVVGRGRRGKGKQDEKYQANNKKDEQFNLDGAVATAHGNIGWRFELNVCVL